MAEATSVGSIASVEAAAIHAEWLDTGKAEFDPRVHGRIARGREVPASAYIRMMRQRAGLIASFERRLASLVRGERIEGTSMLWPSSDHGIESGLAVNKCATTF